MKEQPNLEWCADPDQRVRRQADDLELGPFVPRVDGGAFAGQACLAAGLQAPVLQLEDGGVW